MRQFVFTFKDVSRKYCPLIAHGHGKFCRETFSLCKGDLNDRPKNCPLTEVDE